MSEAISSRGITVWAATLLCTAAAFAQNVPAAPDASDLHHDLAIEATTLQPLESQHVAMPPNPSTASRSQDGAQMSSVSEGINSGQKVAGKYDLRRIGQRGVGSGLDFYSLEKERALGLELSKEVEHDSRVITDPLVAEYINRIGQNLVHNSDAKVPFTIKVLDNDEINAFALPGGFFYVNSGMILATDNEAELAGVMAHEIAHVAARHATKNATKAQIWNLASIPLVFVGGPVGYALRQASGLLVPMGFLKFSRDAEREADLLGLEYDYMAGYDPQSFVSFFEKLQVQEKKKKHSALAKAFSTHPMNEDRIKRAQEEIGQELPAKDDYVVDTSDFEAVKERLIGITDRHMIDGGNGPRPTLRRRTAKAGDDTKDDRRPTLHRKDQ
jgi:beta-barrel assembly-enhancing protease